MTECRMPRVISQIINIHILIKDSVERLWIFQLSFYIADHSIIIKIAVNTNLNPSSSQLFITEYVHLNKRFYAWKKVLHSCFNMPGGWGI